MANANEVIVNGETILDLRSDTVTSKTLQKGYTAHDKSGTKITGTLEVPATEEQTVELSMLSGNQVIQPTNGKVMSKVTVQKPDTLLPENIKKGVVIGGVVGTLEAGGTRETWVINSDASGVFETTQIAFTSNGQNFTAIGANYDDTGTLIILHYDNDEIAGVDIMGGGVVYEFYDEAYRTLTFDTPPTGALLTWLQSNATRQVVEYLTTETDLIKVANAIRAKSGTTAKLSFPDGFVQAIGGEEYDGDYKVTPKFTEEVLKTKNKIMKDNVLVYPIEVARVSNPSGGTTVYIGGITNG